MTLTALITLNAVLGTAVLYGLLHHLVRGIHADQALHRLAEVHSLRERSSDRMAA